MKYIITETQYNTIVEGNKRIDAFQELINNELNRIKDMCDDDDGTNDYDICDETSTISHIIVDDVERFTSKSNPSLIVKINIMYEFMRYRDYTNFTYELQQRLKKSTGLPINIQYETTNLKTNFQW